VPLRAARSCGVKCWSAEDGGTRAGCMNLPNGTSLLAHRTWRTGRI
jgi:hypothetical protein